MKFTHIFLKFTHTLFPILLKFTYSFQFQQKKGLRSLNFDIYAVLSLDSVHSFLVQTKELAGYAKEGEVKVLN